MRVSAGERQVFAERICRLLGSVLVVGLMFRCQLMMRLGSQKAEWLVLVDA